ncbi:MAG: patatin-like phospholipase family protein [Gammaproteobacteria bacterium]|jgi:NTE family protein|nr:patatin-like phospholipase family protein [Gammaproteobacteria bacterium]
MTESTPTTMTDHASPQTALVLSGGGARAAYQVGVLKALAELLPDPAPYRILVGTSAGAVCASVLATHADDWRKGVQQLEAVWSDFTIEQVFRADLPAMLSAGGRWLLSALSGGRLCRAPDALFDNAPLRRLLAREVDWTKIRRHIETGTLQALALTATSYRGGLHRIFFEGHGDIAEWSGVRRAGRRRALTLDHLMASAAIPFLFPAVKLGQRYYGDGAMRQLAPLSPAIHLGADRLLVIGVRGGGVAGITAPTHGYTQTPSSGEIFGFMLDTLFSDQLEADLDQLERTNRLIAGQASSGLREVSALRLLPSADPCELAASHLQRLPSALRRLLGLMGGGNGGSTLLASYLLFEGSYTRDLIALGYSDTLTRRADLEQFIQAAAD